MLSENLIKMYEKSFRDNWDRPAISDYLFNETFTYHQMAEQIDKIHLLFDICKIEKGDKIALIGKNSPRWCITYIATITYGAVIVPILQDFHPNDVIQIINHSDSKLLFCDETYWDSIGVSTTPEINAVFSLSDFHSLDEKRTNTDFQREITEHYNQDHPNGFTPEGIIYENIPNEKIAVINYTSGTTGPNKGVMLSINNLTGNVSFCIDEKLYPKGCRILSFLPLAHAYGCTFDILAAMACGAHTTLLGRVPSPDILIEAMAKVKPIVVCSVPMIIEKICTKRIFPKLEKRLTRIALRLPFVEKIIYSRVRNKLINVFGGEVESFVVGGAAVNSKVEDFLLKIKFPLTVGYGMTECSPLISYSHWSKFKPSSAGRVAKDYMEAKILSNNPQTTPGEIVVRGEHVMSGYYKSPKITAEVLSKDGWLHTGDMGTIDPDGTIYIKGRCKTMLLSANGQNIYPEAIESKLNNLHCVMESLVIQRNGRLVALVVPNYEQLQEEGASLDGLTNIMKRNLTELNSRVASFERVSKITIHPNEFEKTPKKSIKRYLYNT